MTQQRGGRVRRGPVRGTRWIDTLDGRTINDGSTASFTLLGSLGADDIPGLTITRTLLRVVATTLTSPGAFGRQRVIIGGGVITGDGFAAAAFPDLTTDTDYPIRGWLFKMHDVLTLEADSVEKLMIVADIGAFRKLDEQTECFMSITSGSVAGTAISLRVDTLVRMLVKLP